MSAMNDLIEQLQNATTNPTTIDTDQISNVLNELTSEELTDKLDEHNLNEMLLVILKLNSENREELIEGSARCIAEITKNEQQRKKFSQKEIIKVLLELLNEYLNPFNIEIIIQLCRALGNICYLNDDARELILVENGDEILMKLLTINDMKFDSDDAMVFIKVRGGLISNYLLGNEKLAKRVVDLKIIDIIYEICENSLKNIEKNEYLLSHVLPILSILTENLIDLNFEEKLNIKLSEILAGCTNPDVAEICLELLHDQAENDEVKLYLAKNGLCETIYKLLEKHKILASSSQARALMKLACDLIVLILTGDDSMHFLYNTSLLTNMEDWLNSKDVDLLTTGVLALGNFARTDSHCIYMVENNIMNKLLEILAKNNGVDDDVRLQHALLSALRNLVIPKPNKNAIIEAGLVHTILPMLEIHQPPVVFKLLGTLRMTVDGQEKLALDLLQNKKLIEQLVMWSKASDFAGVTGESLRLMAWLIKHGYLVRTVHDSGTPSTPQKSKPLDDTSLRLFIAIDGSVESMVIMLKSPHLVMQNEALIALSILTIVFLNKRDTEINLDDLYIKFDLGKKLAELIKKSSDIMTKEIVENLQKFNSLLQKSEKLSKHLEENNINELLKSIPILTEYCTL